MSLTVTDDIAKSHMGPSVTRTVYINLQLSSHEANFFSNSTHLPNIQLQAEQIYQLSQFHSSPTIKTQSSTCLTTSPLVQKNRPFVTDMH